MAKDKNMFDLHGYIQKQQENRLKKLISEEIEKAMIFFDATGYMPGECPKDILIRKSSGFKLSDYPEHYFKQ